MSEYFRPIINSDPTIPSNASVLQGTPFWFTHAEKLKIELDIQDDFENALKGIVKLPSSSRLGVYVAYRYYFTLFKKIKKISSDRLLEERIRVTNSKKLFITFESVFQNRFNWI